MQKLVWKNSIGNEIDLTTAPYGITNWEGFSSTSLNIQSQQVPFQDGGVFLDALLEQRELTVTLAMYDGNDLEERYRMRRELIHALNPKLGEGYLIYTNDYISKRIKCVPQIPLFETHNSNDSGTPKASLAWTASNPYWEDLVETEVVLIGGETQIINNNGDIPCSIQCRFSGKNITNPFVSNNTTGKIIRLNGSYNSNININTEIGKKEIYQNELDFNNMIFDLINKNQVIYCDKLEKFILTGSTGLIMISADGINWELSAGNTSNNLVAICYDPDLQLLIIGGANGTILTSSDGINWESQTSGINETIIRIIKGNKLVAITGNGTILTSTDAENWVVSASLTGDFFDIVYSAHLGQYTIVGKSRAILTSADAENWSAITFPSGSGDLESIAYSEEQERYVIVGTGGMAFTSVNNTSWEAIAINAQQRSLNKVIYIKELSLFAVFGTGIILTSDTGEDNTWNNVGEQSIATIVYSNKLGLSVGLQSRNIYISYNIKSWKLSSGENISLTDTDSVRGLAYSKQLNILCAVSGRNIAYSKDGVKWNFMLIQAYGYYNKIIFGKDKFVAVGNNGVISISQDGEHWTNIERQFPIINFNSITYSKKLNKYVIVGTNGMILTSADAENWENQTSGISAEINDIVYSEEKEIFVATCAYINTNRYIITSVDGVTWNIRYIYTNGNVPIAITYSDILKKFVLVGYGGMIATSNNGISWVVKFYKTNQRNAIYSSDYYGILIAVGNNGEIIISADGNNWQDRNLNNEFNLNSCTFSEINNSIVIGGQDTVMFTSKEINKENIINNLDNNSNMDLTLRVDNNNILLSSQIGNIIGFISYRQKYIGV